MSLYILGVLQNVLKNFCRGYIQHLLNFSHTGDMWAEELHLHPMLNFDTNTFLILSSRLPENLSLKRMFCCESVALLLTSVTNISVTIIN